MSASSSATLSKADIGSFAELKAKKNPDGLVWSACRGLQPFLSAPDNSKVPNCLKRKRRVSQSMPARWP
jgi:hypothetical protein